MIVDITPIFTELLHNIINLSFTDLSNTQSFLTICLLVENESKFLLRIYGDKLYFENIYDLFYDTKSYCEEHGFDCDALLIETAIKKMKDFVDEEEMVDSFLKFNF
jgi:hypothetical protein